MSEIKFSVLTAELPYAVLIVGMIMVGLYLANQFLDYGSPQYVSRKVGHGIGGVAYLISSYVFSTSWWPIILSSGFCLLLLIPRLLKGPQTFRGVARGTTLAEIWFPVSGTITLIVGWAFLNQPAVSIACILMMAWGDLVTGLCRQRIYKKAVKGVWGSLAMLITCLIIGWCFIQPISLAIAVAIGATLAEWACGDVSKIKFLRRVDDNLAIPIISAAIAFGGLSVLSLL